MAEIPMTPSCPNPNPEAQCAHAHHGREGHLKKPASLTWLSNSRAHREVVALRRRHMASCDCRRGMRGRQK